MGHSMMMDLTGVNNRLSVVEVKEDLYIEVYDKEVIILSKTMIAQTVETLHESQAG